MNAWKSSCTCAVALSLLMMPLEAQSTRAKRDSSEARASSDTAAARGRVVRGDDLRRAGGSSLATSISGKLVGLDVSSPPGTFGELAQLRLRGTWTLLGSDHPLVLVDGIPMELPLMQAAESFPFIPRLFPPLLTDFPLGAIARIETRPSAGEAARYGARAFNGALEIVTIPDSAKPFALRLA